MSNEELEEKALKLILSAGESKMHSMQAIKLAREYRFEEAKNEIKESNKSFISAHDIQTELITEEARSGNSSVNILMVHAQDHITMALMMTDNANEMIEIYMKIKEMEDKIC